MVREDYPQEARAPQAGPTSTGKKTSLLSSQEMRVRMELHMACDFGLHYSVFLGL
jgi:hypothetical protein